MSAPFGPYSCILISCSDVVGIPPVSTAGDGRLSAWHGLRSRGLWDSSHFSPQLCLAEAVRSQDATPARDSFAIATVVYNTLVRATLCRAPSCGGSCAQQ